MDRVVPHPALCAHLQTIDDGRVPPLRSEPLVTSIAALLAWAFLAGCAGRRETFLEGRVEDRCDQSWPVCDRVAGCLLGPESYLSGGFPGNGRFIVRLAEPSTVRVTFFLEEVSSVGTEAVITFYEEGCRARIREPITGKAFVTESQRFDGVARQAELVGEGDHLIEFEADAEARYLVKVDVLPHRGQQ
jgi:hypothetical protein